MLINQKIRLTLSSKRYLTPRSLELTYDAQEAVRYLPGQFFSLTFPLQGGSKTRSYSIVNQALDVRENRTFSFVITLLEGGQASEYFRDASVGSQVELAGPFGNLILPRQDPDRYLLIATGAGVAPYRSMLPELERRMNTQPGLSIELLLGVRDREDLLYEDEFLAFAEQHSQFSFSACYSRQSRVHHAFEHAGYVSSRFDALKPDAEQDMVYLCGHPQMVDQSVTYFEALGFTPARLKREKYLHSAM
ncbi:FAD-binding oxidoreductase [Neptuniibacter halophilus]|uniref:FAD-binding oxidoreductase n=1 Tax=Neptuniibacter halophilus TaxID=651666 RepID=UPI002572E77D|nr:FAD-binding oxidoreductase [Neptuniibacter halophilus]